MALFYNFDTTLKGHVEEVEVDLTQLPYPIFTFPKGSFFVDELYGFITGTKKIVRPGIDYRVLSLNESIKFNDNNASINRQLKDNYTRNAILWFGDASITSVTWMVPYCGGEDSTKADEYSNELDRLYNMARTLGTSNLYVTKNQGFGSFVNAENKQIVDGRNIYSKAYDHMDVINNQGGLGYGKIQLSMMAIADVIANGGDPLELQAYYHWIRHNTNVFNDYKDGLFEDLQDKLDDLDDKRVSNYQFVYSDNRYNHYSNHHFLEYNATMLRGASNNSSVLPDDATPIDTGRTCEGFRGLGSWGEDFELDFTRLSQRRGDANMLNVLKTKIKFLGHLSVNNPDALGIDLEVENRDKATANGYTLHLVSKRLGLLLSKDVTAHVKTGSGSLRTTYYYSPNPADYSDDILFAYVLDDNLNGDMNNEVKRFRHIPRSQYGGYELRLNTNALVVADDEVITKNPTIINADAEVIGTGELSVTVIRKLSDYPETCYLGFTSIDTNPEYTTVREPVVFAAGETTKVVNINAANHVATTNHTIVVKLNRFNWAYDTNFINELASVVVGYRKTTNNNRAYISLHDSQSDTVIRNSQLTVGDHLYWIKMQYARNMDFHRVNPNFKWAVTDPDNITDVPTITLGDYVRIDSDTVMYPISIISSNATDVYVPLMLWFEDTDNNFITNKMNVFVTQGDQLHFSSINNLSISTTNVGYVDASSMVVNFQLYQSGINVGSTVGDSATISFSTANDPNDGTNIEIVTPPYYESNRLRFSARFPASYWGLETTFSFTKPNGTPMGSVSYTPAVTNKTYLIDRNGKVIDTVRLNQPFRIMRTANKVGSKPTTSTSVINPANISNVSTGLTWGGDAIPLSVGHKVLKDSVTYPSSSGIQISVDGWLSIVSMDPYLNGGVNQSNYGAFVVQTTQSWDNAPNTVTNDRFIVSLGVIEAKIFEYNGGEEITNGELLGDVDYNVTFTSKDVDLTGIATITPMVLQTLTQSTSLTVNGSIQTNHLDNFAVQRFTAGPSLGRSSIYFLLEKYNGDRITVEYPHQITISQMEPPA